MTDFTKILDKAKELEAKMKESQEKIKEITALGAGAAAYLFINNLPLENMNSFISQSKTWNPNMDSKQREHYLNKWNKAINKSKQWT